MILAIDQSYSGTGVCFIDKNGNIETGLIKTKSKDRWETRIDTILDALDFFFYNMAEQKDSPVEHVVIESYALGSHSSSVFQLGELGGCIKYHFHKKWGKDVRTMLIAHPKMYIAGNGRAMKGAVMEGLREKFSIIAKNDNVADAIAIGLTYKAYLNGDWENTRYNQKLFQKIKDYMGRKNNA